MSDYVLVNCEEREAEFPDRFVVPPAEHRYNINAGTMVKLIFGLKDVREVVGCDGERMWVEVDGRSKIGDTIRYRGTLANQPVVLTGLKFGDQVEFGPEHVADIQFRSVQTHSSHNREEPQTDCGAHCAQSIEHAVLSSAVSEKEISDPAASFVEQFTRTGESVSADTRRLVAELRTQYKFLVAAMTLVQEQEPGITVSDFLDRMRALGEDGYVKTSISIAEAALGQGVDLTTVESGLKLARSNAGKKMVEEAYQDLLWDRMKKE